MTVIENLPAPVRETGLFCCWKYEERDGKQTKVPYNPVTGLRARSNDPATFAPLSVAATASGPYDGLGVGIFNGLCAIDLDHCLENGCLNELATDVALTMNTYTEFPPAERGCACSFTPPAFNMIPSGITSITVRLAWRFTSAGLRKNTSPSPGTSTASTS